MKKIIILSVIVLLAATGLAQALCLQSSGGLYFDIFYNTTTGNAEGTWSSSTGNGTAYGTYWPGSGFTLTWLNLDAANCSGIYQGDKWIGNGTPVYMENSCGAFGDRTLSICVVMDEPNQGVIPDDQLRPLK